MDTPSGLSSRMSNVIASVLPKIATTVGERSSKGPAKIDLATAENWLARRELIDIYKQAIAQDLDPQVSALLPLPVCMTDSYPCSYTDTVLSARVWR